MSAPCHVCGAATDRAVETRVFRTPLGSRDPQYDYEVGTCAACATLRLEEPGAAVRLCLRLLGKDEAEDAAFAPVLLDQGVDASAFLFERTGKPRQGPQRKAFAHVGREPRQMLRRAYARMLALRVERAAEAPPRPTPPPDGAPPACLACGVGEAEAWHGPTLTSALTRGPQMVTGYFCPPCASALEAVGAVGPTFLENAVMASRGIDWVPPRLRAWAATGLPPRPAPWDWVDATPPALELDPWSAAMEEIAALTARVEALEAGRG